MLIAVDPIFWFNCTGYEKTVVDWYGVLKDHYSTYEKTVGRPILGMERPLVDLWKDLLRGQPCI